VASMTVPAITCSPQPLSLTLLLPSDVSETRTRTCRLP
jgi:hypothetical protein